MPFACSQQLCSQDSAPAKPNRHEIKRSQERERGSAGGTGERRIGKTEATNLLLNRSGVVDYTGWMATLDRPTVTTASLDPQTSTVWHEGVEDPDTGRKKRGRGWGDEGEFTK